MILGILALGSLGCDDGPRLVAISGTVTLDGAPVSDAALAFEPTQPGPLAACTTDAAGKFSLVTSNRDGLVPGEYRVSVTKYEMLGIDPLKPGDFSKAKMEWIVPERYSQVATSGLSYKLEESEDELNIELRSQP